MSRHAVWRGFSAARFRTGGSFRRVKVQPQKADRTPRNPPARLIPLRRRVHRGIHPRIRMSFVDRDPRGASRVDRRGAGRNRNGPRRCGFAVAGTGPWERCRRNIVEDRKPAGRFVNLRLLTPFESGIVRRNGGM